MRGPTEVKDGLVIVFHISLSGGLWFSGYLAWEIEESPAAHEGIGADAYRARSTTAPAQDTGRKGHG